MEKQITNKRETDRCETSKRLGRVLFADIQFQLQCFYLDSAGCINRSQTPSRPGKPTRVGGAASVSRPWHDRPPTAAPSRPARSPLGHAHLPRPRLPLRTGPGMHARGRAIWHDDGRGSYKIYRRLIDRSPLSQAPGMHPCTHTRAGGVLPPRRE